MQTIHTQKTRKSTVIIKIAGFALLVSAVVTLNACSLNASTELRTDIPPIERTQAGPDGPVTTDGAEGAASKDKVDGAQPQNSLPVPKDRVQANKGGNVTLQVTWKAEQASSEELALSVAMDTHSEDLDQFDLSQLSVLRNDKGQEVRPSSWNAPLGGHHRSGMLVFPLVVDSKPLIAADTKYIELVIRNVSGVEERVLHWDLKGG